MLSCLRNNPSDKWCILGDTNIVAGPEDKLGGSPFDLGKARVFFKFMESSSLVEIPIKGGTFTWSNQRKEGEPILEKLDRVLASLEWSFSFPKAFGVVDAAIASDHSPIFLLLQGSPKRARYDFKFESKWLLEDECSKKVSDSWKPSLQGPTHSIFGKKLRKNKK
ncbi:hypothetical protein V6N11_070924 [Hibiscus sabdariffa]|uniref:Uncharacterized protein n=2 Tax=Hibiscus sabdariffa TaxID=183260 RepID=A0ABR2DB61_9ROSI